MDFKQILTQVLPVVLGTIPATAPFVPLYVMALSVAENSKKPGADKRVIGKQVLEVSAKLANAVSEARGHGTAIDVDETLSLYDKIVDDSISTVKLIQSLGAPAELQAPAN